MVDQGGYCNDEGLREGGVLIDWTVAVLVSAIELGG